MEMEPVPGYSFANWELGYGDVHMVPDLATLRVATWLDKTAFVLCDVKSEKTHDYVAVAPRSILRRQVDAAKKLGYTGYAGTELEHYLFQTSYRQAAQQDYRNLEPAGWYLEDYHMLQGTRTEGFHAAARRHLKNSGVPVENSKGEWGKGQHELNVRYAEVLDMADRHVVFKQCLKEIAEAMGMSVTFMAKFAADGAGSSCHIHFSLWRDKKNAFEKGGDLFRWFLGGWIAHVPDVMVFYAPTVNSYKRYVDGSWAPTRMAWSIDNRTAGFRVVGSGQSLRIECRIPGADCNPYLALAASLASGPRRHRQQDRAAGSLRRRHLPGERPAAGAVYAQPRLWRRSRTASSPRRRSAKKSWSTTATSIAPKQRPTTKRSPTGNAADTSRGYETKRQGRAHHRRGQRHRPADGAAVRQGRRLDRLRST